MSGSSLTEVVVTGASGFVGRAVCQELLTRGAIVHAITRTTSSVVAGSRHRQVADYAQLDGPAGAICIHLAGEARSGHADPAERAAALEVAHALAARFPRLIFASSGLVYGDRIAEPRSETHPVDPRGEYAAAKRAVEEVILSHDRTVARLANVYGPGMSPDTVFSDVLRQIPGKGDLHVRNATAVRDFIHVEDVARGLVDLALSTSNGTFNLGTGVGTSIGELASGIAKQAGEGDRRVVATLPHADPSCLVLNPTKMKQTVGWEAAIGFAEGIEGLLRKHPNAP